MEKTYRVLWFLIVSSFRKISFFYISFKEDKLLLVSSSLSNFSFKSSLSNLKIFWYFGLTLSLIFCVKSLGILLADTSPQAIPKNRLHSSIILYVLAQLSCFFFAWVVIAVLLLLVCLVIPKVGTRAVQSLGWDFSSHSHIHHYNKFLDFLLHK